jgi:xylan 1,4-beta-xylosidase
MGRPKDLTAEQLARMELLTADLPDTDKVVRAGSDGTLEWTVAMNSNDIVLLTLTRVRD